MSIDTYSETPKIKHLLEKETTFISTFYYSALLQDFK